MSTIRVTWGYRTAIGSPTGETVRTMVQQFGSAAKAAEFACDILYVLYGPDVANAHTEKDYKVGKHRPRIRFDSTDRAVWVEVTYNDYPTGAGVGREKRAAVHSVVERR